MMDDNETLKKEIEKEEKKEKEIKVEKKKEEKKAKIEKEEKKIDNKTVKDIVKIIKEHKKGQKSRLIKKLEAKYKDMTFTVPPGGSLQFQVDGVNYIYNDDLLKSIEGK